MPLLQFQGQEEIISQPDLYARIDVQKYRLNAPDHHSDRELLTALVRNPDYCTESLRLAETRESHGPYLLQAIPGDTFEVCHADDAMQSLAAWLRDPRGATTDEGSTLRSRVVPLLKGAVYRIPEGLEGPLSVSGTWLEFVAIDRPSASLVLVMAWDD